MTPQELKSSILQYAIQGKLVEQRPEEGTGKELFQQIQTEKQALIKAGRIKKEKHTEDFGEIESPFDIPDSWHWCRIEDCGCFISGYTPKPHELDSVGAIPYFKVSDMNTAGNERYLIHTSNYLRSNDAKCFWKDTIVYPKNGGAVFTNKKRILHQNSVVDLNTGGYYPYAPMDVDYIYIYFANIDFCKCYKGTALPTIDMDKMRSKMIPVPPLAEQKRIVAKLEEILPLIDRYEAAWNKLEEFNKRFPGDMQKSILQLAIQGKLVEQCPEEGTGEELFQQIQAEKQALIKAGKIKKEKPLPEITEDEIPFDIPETWKWGRLGKISWYFDAGKSPNCLKQPVTGSDWGVITTTAVQLGYFDEVQNKILPPNFAVNPEIQVRAGDILITRAGPTNRTGIACLVKDINYNLILSDKIIRINMTDNHFYKDYLVMVLNSPQIRNLIVGLMSGMDKQQVNVSQDKYRSLLVPIPPLAEQKRIVAKLEEILPLCECLK